jgi:hypothetical protein
MIADLDNINDIIKAEGLDLLVISYGGSCSNTLINVFKKNNYNCDTKIWKILLCHCPRYINVDIPIIYIYDNPIKSFMSMKNRANKPWITNQKKLSNNTNVDISDENLLKLMINQFNEFTNIKSDNVLVINSKELFGDTIVNKLENFLGKKLDGFPIEYIKPKTDINNIEDIQLLELFKKYKSDIDIINNFK